MEPRDFISVARRLQSSGDEAEVRTSISRAYYGLFHVIQHRLAARGVPFHGHGDDHRLVVTYLKQGTSSLKKIMTVIVQLRTMRNKADYVLSLLVTKGDAQRACKSASEAADEFDAISEPEIQVAIQKMQNLR